MSIQERIAEIESQMTRDDISSVVYGVDYLLDLFHTATATDALLVGMSLCPWLDMLERHHDLVETATQIRKSPHAEKMDVLWARYWEARASARIDDTDPTDRYLEILGAMGDVVSPDATTLGNRLWNSASATWGPTRFLSAYVPWATPRFAGAEVFDRSLIGERIDNHVNALEDSTAQREWLNKVLRSPGFDEREFGSPFRTQLARLYFTSGAFDEARVEYLRVAADMAVSADPNAVELEIIARQEAARAAAKTGDVATSIRELGELVRRPAKSLDVSRVLASARLTWVAMLREHAPTEGDREGLAMWRDLGHDSDESLAYLAGLALANSWDDLDPQVTVERATWILSRFPAPETPDLITLVVMALNSRTRALADEGDEEAALVDAERAFAFPEDAVPDFVRATTARNREGLRLRRGDYRDRDEIYGVVRRLLDEANAASERGDREGSARSYWRVFEMSQPSPDSATRLVGLKALEDWTVDLLTDRDDRRAADIARRSIEAAIMDDGPGTDMLARAWLQLGVAANRLADESTARHAFAQVLAVAGDTPESRLAETASTARWNLAFLRDDGKAPLEALRLYGGVIAQGASNSSLAMQRLVAKALKNSAIVLRDELNQPAQAGGAWNEIVTRFDGHPDAELSRLVAEAKQNAPRPTRRGLFGRRR